MNKLKIWLICSFAGLLSGCDLIEYHPYVASFDGEKHINQKNIEKIEAICLDKDTIRFILMGDTQRWYDETEDFVTHLNTRNDVDFVIHGGDISDFGLTKEFVWIRDIMSKLKVPYVALIGNHDIIGNGKDVFLKMYGDENFSFIAGNTKFVCLNTNALEYDYSHPVPDFNYIEEEQNDTISTYTRTVCVMHTKPGDEQFNNNVSKLFHRSIKELRNLQFCLHAHNHRLQVDNVFGDGIIYYGCSCMADRNYLLFTLTPKGYTYEVVDY